MKREHFQLKSVKILNSGGIEAVYAGQKEDSEVTHEMENKVKDSVVPHPDLNSKLRKCGDLTFKMLGLDAIGKKNSERQAAERERINCYKLTVSGDRDKPQVIVTSKLECGGYKVPVNSPKVSAENNAWNVDLVGTISDIEDEVFEYVFNNKKAQLELGDNED